MELMIIIISWIFIISSLFKSPWSSEHSTHSEVSCVSILFWDIQSGYGGQSWLLNKEGIGSAVLQISHGISPVSWLSFKCNWIKLI